MADNHFLDDLARLKLEPEQVAELITNRRRLLRRLGPRHNRCRLHNYSTEQDPGQAKVLAKARQYAEQLRQNIISGKNLVFFGAAGTGKDHLLAALANVAQHRGATVEFTTGPELFLEFRQAMKKTEAEAELLRRLLRPHVLWISDPVPPGCRKLTGHQAASLFAVIDGRYRMQRPVWISCNLSSRDEANEVLTVPIADRLRDGAVTANFNWPSYRGESGE